MSKHPPTQPVPTPASPSPTPTPLSPSSPYGEDEDAALLDELSPLELDALRWSVRVADGLTGQAQEQFEAWLATAPEHRRAYAEMTGVFDALDTLPADAAAGLSTRVVLDKLSSLPPAPPVRRGRLTLLPHALAGAALLLTLGGGWAGWSHWQSLPVFSQHYASARGQQLAADLPDGSRLQFDTATSADVTLYRQRRQVVLAEGQALFKVQGDQARPFDVLAGAARITVVGTRFSVRHTPSGGNHAVRIAVLEGRVKVQGAGDAGAVYLLPGQTVSADARGHVGAVTGMPIDAMASWLDGRLGFDNVPLADVLAELARYGDSGLRLGDAAAGRLPVTANIDLRHLDGFARSLPLVLPVRLQRDGDGKQLIVSLPK